MGAENVTVQNLSIVKIDAENNLIAIRGAIPGAKGGVVFITDSVKGVREGGYTQCQRFKFMIWPARPSAKSSFPTPFSALRRTLWLSTRAS